MGSSGVPGKESGGRGVGAKGCTGIGQTSTACAKAQSVADYCIHGFIGIYYHRDVER